MSTVTDNYGYVLPAEGEPYDVAIPNSNNIGIDAKLKSLSKARVATFNMVAPRGSIANQGDPWGFLGIDTGRSASQNQQNDFCVVDNTGTAGQPSEKGRVRITKQGIYDFSANYAPATNPGNVNFAIAVDKIEGGTDKYSMNRTGTYGDNEASVSFTGVFLKVGDFVTGYQTNSNAVSWAMGLKLTYVGEAP